MVGTYRRARHQSGSYFFRKEGYFMLSYIWPIALVVLANTFYQICAKATPEAMNPLAALTVT